MSTVERITARAQRAAMVAAEAARAAARWAAAYWAAHTGRRRIVAAVEAVEAVAKPDPGWVAAANDLRADMLRMCGKVLDETLGTLEHRGCTRVKAAPDGRKAERTALGERRRAGSASGTYDWWWSLSAKEQARLRRNGWVTRDPAAVTPDEMPDLLGAASLDEAMEEWVRLTRIVDGCRSLAHRRAVPAWCRQGELLPSFDDWEANLILSPDRAVAAAHAAEVDAELAARYVDEMAA